MPRIRQSKEKYMRADTSALIRRKMYESGITQNDIGNIIGRTQSNVSARISQMSFSYSELVKIFDKLDFTDEEVLKCMKK